MNRRQRSKKLAAKATIHVQDESRSIEPKVPLKAIVFVVSNFIAAIVFLRQYFEIPDLVQTDALKESLNSWHYLSSLRMLCRSTCMATV